MPRGGTLGYRGGGGGWGSKIFFPEIQSDLVCELHEWYMHRHNVLGPRPLGRGQKFNFLNMVK